MTIWATEKEQKVCARCEHFHQHYVEVGFMDYRWVNAGHCDYPRMKAREPKDTCKYFKERGKE